VFTQTLALGGIALRTTLFPMIVLICITGLSLMQWRVMCWTRRSTSTVMILISYFPRHALTRRITVAADSSMTAMIPSLHSSAVPFSGRQVLFW
jgi:hypothetical protein